MAHQTFYTRYGPGKYGLVIDWETSGSTFGGDSSLKFQGVAFGALIFNTETFEEVASLYREIKFDASKYEWSAEAEKIHGLSREHLAEHGVEREDALADFLELLLSHFAPGSRILIAGHNVGFDKDFTTQLCRDHGVAIEFHHISLDSSSAAYLVTGEYKSDVVFDLLAGLDKREMHNALEDARACLAVLRNIRGIFNLGFAA